MNELKKKLIDHELLQQQASNDMEATKKSAVERCRQAQERLELLAREKNEAQLALDVVRQELENYRRFAANQQLQAQQAVVALNAALTEAEDLSSKLQDDLRDLKQIFDQQKAAICELRACDEVCLPSYCNAFSRDHHTRTLKGVR